MTQITSQDGKIVFRDGKVGTANGCCCVTPCNRNCNKTITVEWTNNGASGTLIYTVADGGISEQIFGLRVSSVISCRSDGKWSVVVIFCAAAPYRGGSVSSIFNADASGCPPIGNIGWTTFIGLGPGGTFPDGVSVTATVS